MFQFIHAADIHLDSPLKGLEQYPEAPTQIIRTAPRDAMVQLVDLAIEQNWIEINNRIPCYPEHPETESAIQY